MRIRSVSYLFLLISPWTTLAYSAEEIIQTAPFLAGLREGGINHQESGFYALVGLARSVSYGKDLDAQKQAKYAMVNAFAGMAKDISNMEKVSDFSRNHYDNDEHRKMRINIFNDRLVLTIINDGSIDEILPAADIHGRDAAKKTLLRLQKTGSLYSDIADTYTLDVAEPRRAIAP